MQSFSKKWPQPLFRQSRRPALAGRLFLFPAGSSPAANDPPRQKHNQQNDQRRRAQGRQRGQARVPHQLHRVPAAADGLSPIACLSMGVTLRYALLSKGLEVGLPLLDLIALPIPKDAVVEVRDWAPVSHFGLQGEKPLGLLLHRSQHLGGVHTGDHSVEPVILQL